MFGNVKDLIRQTPAKSRLMCGLLFLQDYLEGRAPVIAKIVSNLKIGDSTRVSLEGDSLYVLIQAYKTREPDEAKFEAHQHHTDLQYICAGREWIALCDLRKQRSSPTYDQKGNVYFALGKQPRTRVLLESGEIAVLFPNDAHAPCLRVDGADDSVVKIVVKIKDADLDKIPV